MGGCCSLAERQFYRMPMLEGAKAMRMPMERFAQRLEGSCCSPGEFDLCHSQGWFVYCKRKNKKRRKKIGSSQPQV